MSVEETLFREYLDEGVPPEQAREMAKEEADNRAADSKIASQQARNFKKAKKNVAGQSEQSSTVGIKSSLKGGRWLIHTVWMIVGFVEHLGRG
jgi:hypothetical protein